jgi:hypothetical protein
MLSEKAQNLAMLLWEEQYLTGITDEVPDRNRLEEWITNRTYPESLLEKAVFDAAYLFYVRIEAGLQPFI